VRGGLKRSTDEGSLEVGILKGGMNRGGEATAGIKRIIEGNNKGKRDNTLLMNGQEVQGKGKAAKSIWPLSKKKIKQKGNM
jgi:hypothetical protein